MQGDEPGAANESAGEPLPETVEVREAHRFDTVALEKMLLDKIGAGMDGIRQMRGGQSNPTFILSTDKGEFVMRKQPPGKLLPSAHAVDREYRVLSALGAVPTLVDELVRRCQVSAASVAEVLLALELEGRLERHRGNRVSLIEYQ